MFCRKIVLAVYFSLSLARSNFSLSLKFLRAFKEKGLKYIVLSPGSRSGPLASAAGFMSESGELNIIPAIDERSAGFLALGISKATVCPPMVITTSGTAVANLLPSAVEADMSCQQILFVTADRPSRLKNCGANQTVNQEDFLRFNCRSFFEGPPEGFHTLSLDGLNQLVQEAWNLNNQIPGPVHINIPFEEPLHASSNEKIEITKGIELASSGKNLFKKTSQKIINAKQVNAFTCLDPFKPGIVIAGPWRGRNQDLSAYLDVLKQWQDLSGWPIFADPLSGVCDSHLEIISYWEIIISSGFLAKESTLQVLRLGPLPASRNLEKWLSNLQKPHLLITEGDSRNLDPLGMASQWSGGLVDWWKNFLQNYSFPKDKSVKPLGPFFEKCALKDEIVASILNEKLPLKGKITEPSLAKWIPVLWPSGSSIMLSASSPIRDWIAYGGKPPFSRRCFGFRGASGIDGTLSLGMGLSTIVDPLLLVTGDLALLHDTNGWLFSDSISSSLVVLLIDNGGGGIFHRLNIENTYKDQFRKYFLMPQSVDPISLAASYGIPFRQVSCLEDLELSLEWGLSFSRPVLIRVCTNPVEDNKLREEICISLKKYL